MSPLGGGITVFYCRKIFFFCSSDISAYQKKKKEKLKDGYTFGVIEERKSFSKCFSKVLTVHSTMQLIRPRHPTYTSTSFIKRGEDQSKYLSQIKRERGERERKKTEKFCQMNLSLAVLSVGGEK